MTKRYDGERRFDASPEILKAALRYALRRIHRNNVQWTSNTVTFSVSTSWWSWGERVIVNFEHDGTIRAASTSKVWTTCIDWGKNKRNVEGLFDWMEEYLELHA